MWIGVFSDVVEVVVAILQVRESMRLQIRCFMIRAEKSFCNIFSFEDCFCPLKCGLLGLPGSNI